MTISTYRIIGFFFYALIATKIWNLIYDKVSKQMEKSAAERRIYDHY
jgi:hypothetical protein